MQKYVIVKAESLELHNQYLILVLILRWRKNACILVHEDSNNPETGSMQISTNSVSYVSTMC